MVGVTLRIRRSDDNGDVIFALSGRIEERHVLELEAVLEKEAKPGEVMLDLAEVKLVDREAIRFLASCKARGIGLKNCPSYIRRWIEQGIDISHEP
jgi:STAS domain-containing protein